MVILRLSTPSNFKMIFLGIVIATLAIASSEAALAAKSTANARPIRRLGRNAAVKGVKNNNRRRLSKSGKGGGGGETSRTSGGFFTGQGLGDGGGKGGASKKQKAAESSRTSDGFGTDSVAGISNKKSKGDTSAAAMPLPASNNNYYDTTTSALITYDNKCDAAAAGAEFKTASFVPVYYKYELVTSTARNVLEVVDVIDNAIQDFLSIWLVDCDTVAATATETTSENMDNNGIRRKLALEQQREKRHLQMTLAPIVGTGVGDYDTVLFGGTDEETCKSLVASSTMGQICYQVIGSVLIYIDETMQVTPEDVQTIALETLTVGMNYAATDFSLLDPDIYGLFLVQGYDEPPQTLLTANAEANKRPWDTSTVEELSQESSQGRSGGAKFGIAFVTLLCVALFLFLCVYMYKNRERLFTDFDWEDFFFCCCCCCRGDGSVKKNRKLETKHHSLDESTVQSTKYDVTLARAIPDDAGSRGSATFRTFSSSPESTGTRPLSPDPETPHYVHAEQRLRQVQDPPEDQNEEEEIYVRPTYMEQKSNIVSPRSDLSDARSTITDYDVDEMISHPAGTPDDRLRIKLSMEAMRASHRKPYSKEISSPRGYEIEDTVAL